MDDQVGGAGGDAFQGAAGNGVVVGAGEEQAAAREREGLAGTRVDEGEGLPRGAGRQLQGIDRATGGDGGVVLLGIVERSRGRSGRCRQPSGVGGRLNGADAAASGTDPREINIVAGVCENDAPIASQPVGGRGRGRRDRSQIRDLDIHGAAILGGGGHRIQGQGRPRATICIHRDLIGAACIKRERCKGEATKGLRGRTRGFPQEVKIAPGKYGHRGTGESPPVLRVYLQRAATEIGVARVTQRTGNNQGARPQFLKRCGSGGGDVRVPRIFPKGEGVVWVSNIEASPQATGEVDAIELVGIVYRRPRELKNYVRGARRPLEG